jgi:hypothetical protein
MGLAEEAPITQLAALPVSAEAPKPNEPILIKSLLVCMLLIFSVSRDIYEIENGNSNTFSWQM